MEGIATIGFKDRESADNGTVVIRAQKGIVGLAISLEKDGDLEVFLAPSDCHLVMDALRGALAKAI